MTPRNALHASLFLLLVGALGACRPAAKPVTLTPELTDLASWLKATPYTPAPKEAKAPPPVRVLTLSEMGDAAVRAAGAEPVRTTETEAWLLARDATQLVAGLETAGVHYVLTPEPDLRDARNLPQDKPTLVPSLLRHLQTLYGTGTRDHACVDRLQLIKTSVTIHDFDGRHLPTALLYRRVPGALLHMTKLVPGIPVRVESARRVGDVIFVFDCQARADAKGELNLRFPYPSTPEMPVKMWTAMDKGGDLLTIPADAVLEGKTVEISE